MNAPPDKTALAPPGAETVALGIAAMHDRAARRSADPRLRLLHEQCAMHLRSLADDPAALASISHAAQRTEATNEDFSEVLT